MLYLSAIFLSLFLSLMLLAKKQKADSDPILIAWLAVIGVHLLTFYLTYTKQTDQYPSWAALGIPLPLAHGPFLYLYTRSQLAGRRFQTRQILHFIPLVLSYLLFARFFFLPFDQQVEVFHQKGAPFFQESRINLYAIYVSGVVYITLSLYSLFQYKKNLVQQFSNTEKITFNWLLYLICWMVVIWGVVLYVGDAKYVFGVVALFVLWIGYFSIHQVQVFNNIPPLSQDQAIIAIEAGRGNSEQYDLNDAMPAKYHAASLSQELASSIHQHLAQILDDTKPYLNPELTLNDLAKMVHVHPNILSQVINTREGKTFYDLINERRINEFVSRISMPGHEKYTLIGIAYECGFNSKATFNRNFKKHMHVTPTDYIKNLQGIALQEVSSN